jgi:hypothetical protein
MARLTPECDDQARRALVTSQVNGIDYLEVSQDQRTLRIFFLKPLLAGAYGLPANPSRVAVQGGVRIRNIQVVEVRQADESVLEVDVSTPGDFSTYTLSIDSASLDPAYSQVDFSFKAGCPNRFDCKPRQVCPKALVEEPVIDYMARDYASFRRALLDFLSTRKPDWKERHEADIGIAILEALAYVGDHLSYNLDAVANEPYLDTARQRISVRRHARLVDYRMHDGASARTWVHFRMEPGAPVGLPAEAEVLTRLDRQLGAAFPPFPAVLPAGVADLARDAATAVFQTMHAVQLDSSLNEMAVHTWGNRQCCLPPGARSVELVGDRTAVLKEGTFLLFEEVKGVATGLPADADRTHRQVVRLVKVELTKDPLLNVALTRVAWADADALRFPLCLSALLGDGTFVPDVSVARGNLALADHGRRRSQWHPYQPRDPHEQGVALGARAYRFELDEGPLSFRIAFDPSAPAVLLEATDPAAARPQVVKTSVYVPPRIPPQPPEGTWNVTPDLLASGPFAQEFAVETNNRGQAQLRFGDNVYGQALPDGAFVYVDYRTGVGTEGLIGAEALAHTTATAVPGIAAIRNPLPAWGGIDPEPLERVKRLAPAAFHAEQFRAVTEDDYARAAEKHPQVAKAVARFRWTGSWLTVFVTIDPRGTQEVSASLKGSVKNWLTRYTLAGYDLEIVPPRYVPLDVDLDVCVKRDHFRADVEAALLEALSSGVLSDGTPGFFHPDRHTFGEPLYLSALYAAASAVEGVDSVNASRFRRQDEDDPDPARPATAFNLARGYVPIGSLEILRLSNDPNFPEHGRLRLNMMGGK